MKKVLILLCLILLSMLNSFVFSSEKLTENGYNSITKKVAQNTSVLDNPKHIISYFSGMEVDFNSFINEKHSKNKNSELFGVYMQNMELLRDRFYELSYKCNQQNQNILEHYNISIDSDEKDDSYYRFTYPYVANILLDLNDCFCLVFDYKNMQEKYSSYLNSAWNTYLKYCIEEMNDREECFAHDGDEDYGEITMQMYNKWVKKWTIFTTLYPNFPLNEQIKKEIKDLENVANCNFNIGTYIFLWVLIGIAIIALITAIIFLSIKFNIICKIKTFDKKMVESIVKHRTAIFTMFGIVIIILLGTLLHNTFSIPTCDSQFAEETIISNFKQSDYIYKPNEERVAEIEMSNFKPITYNRDINKYTCSATLTMYSKKDSPIFFLVPYNSFTYDVNYEIYKERGKNKVNASWQMQNIGLQDIRR